MHLTTIAHIHTDFREKFGTPRQAGLVPDVVGRIVFTPEFRNPDFLRGITDFSHLWLLWGFSLNRPVSSRPTVRPPRLGGNRRMGVFATRSPYRPNPIGLSCVRLLGLQDSDEGSVLLVSGVDMVDGTPLYDIKPYLPYADAHPQAAGGFTDLHERHLLSVTPPPDLDLPKDLDAWNALLDVLAQDPRPAYNHDPNRIYGLSFASFNVRFQVDDTTHILTLLSVE